MQLLVLQNFKQIFKVLNIFNYNYFSFLRIWFGIGVIVGLFLMFLGVFILAINLVWILNKPKEELVLTPMV